MNKSVFVLLAGICFCILSCINSADYKADAYGNFEADDLMISALGTGKLVYFQIEEGITLNPGITVGVIDTSRLSIKKDQLLAKKQTLYAKINTVNAELQVTQEQFKKIEKAYNRISALIKDSATTQQKYEQIEGDRNILFSRLEVIEAQSKAIHSELLVLKKQIEEINNQIHDHIIINPMAGTVLETYIHQFELVTPGKPLYKIANLNKIILKAYISGDQLSEINLGSMVKVFIDAKSNNTISYAGRISWISPMSEFTPKIIQTKEERVNMVYAIKVEVVNDGRIKIGMPGEIYFNM
jgi:HlyD family secretion protein